MSHQLGFRVQNSGRLMIVVSFPGCMGEKPRILTDIMGRLKLSPNNLICDFMEKFPEDAAVIRLLNGILVECEVKSVSGIHWNSATGHSIHIEIE